MTSDFYTLIVVPHAKARFRKFQVSVKLTKWALGVSTALALAILGMLVHYTRIAVEVADLQRLRSENEALTIAAQRELLEETGYEAARWTLVVHGPPSAGMSDECVAVFLAEGLTRVHAGGGDDTENITVHAVPVSDAVQWLQAAANQGKMIDPKVYAGLFFASLSTSP